ncbi:MAG TPA: protein kinase [Thermoanaerobaculia bacterium]|nr:protein kinase [Thermoanaerobaculia bacterium]
MVLARGVSLGPYEILSPIGSGGMGEVWRARDKRIGRDVAVKILADSFGAADDLVRRFEQEARAAGALNHPGLVTIFDVGTYEGAPYIVMELLDGETVREAIDRAQPHPMSLRKSVDYAIQIAEALSVAHEKGILHRDLKPENLFITSDKRVKILDFGLAKLAEAKDSEGKQRTGRHLTSAGIVVGTPGYMSPEQVRAQPLDARTDIFSFGTVLYEMLTGKSPFERDSAIETMHAVLAVDPPAPSAVQPEVPASLDAIVRHCMEKDPRERFQSARDLAFQLRMLTDLPGAGTNTRRVAVATERRRIPWRPIAMFAAALALLGAGGLGVAKFGDATGREAPARTFQQLTFGDGVEMLPTLSPDGKTFAYVSSVAGNRDIYVQRVDGRTPINVTADSADDDSEPAFSPDGSQIVFRSERDGGGIFVMGVTGESVRRITNFGHNPAWSPDGTRVVVSTAATEMRPHVHNVEGQLYIVQVATGASRELAHTRTNASDAVQPSWSPHGGRIAFWGLTSGGQRDIWTIAPDAAKPAQTITRITADAALDWNPIWSPDGQYLYFGSDRDGTLNLWRVEIDEERGVATGRPEPLALPSTVAGNFALAADGTLIYATALRSSRLLALPFDTVAGAIAEPRALLGGSHEIFNFDVSPDGQSIAFTTGGPREDVFVANSNGSRLRQLTNDGARDRGVIWTPDGKTLYFYSDRGGVYHVWSIRADGSGLAPVTDARDLQRLPTAEAFVWPEISPDGRRLTAATSEGVALIHLDRPLGQRADIATRAMVGAAWSPDGTRLAGRSRDESTRRLGGTAVYSLAAKRVSKLSEEPFWPQWLPDGKRLAVISRDSIRVIDAQTGAGAHVPFRPPSGVRNEPGVSAPPRLSRDGSTLYARQVTEEGDIWLVHFPPR